MLDLSVGLYTKTWQWHKRRGFMINVNVDSASGQS
jgi:hypothetical protein